MKKNNLSGFSIVEVIVVVLLVALIGIAIYPYIRTAYNSWITADRREEQLELGRLGLDKIIRSLRQSSGLADATSSTYFIFNQGISCWSATNPYCFTPPLSNVFATYTTPFATYTIQYDNTSTYDILFGLQSDAVQLVGPIDSFTYNAYNRRVVETATKARRITSYGFRFAVSDSRKKVNPLKFDTRVHPRVDREGWIISNSSTFATDTPVFTFNDTINILVWSNRLEPTLVTTANVFIKYGDYTNCAQGNTIFSTGPFYLTDPDNDGLFSTTGIRASDVMYNNPQNCSVSGNPCESECVIFLFNLLDSNSERFGATDVVCIHSAAGSICSPP